jgi:hypothetical protein
MQTMLQDVEFNDQQRFDQFVAQSKSHMEVGRVLYMYLPPPVYLCVTRLTLQELCTSWEDIRVVNQMASHDVTFKFVTRFLVPVDVTCLQHSSTVDVYFSGWMQSQITGGGHGIAAARMGGMLNVAGWVSEQMGGLRCFL